MSRRRNPFLRWGHGHTFVGGLLAGLAVSSYWEAAAAAAAVLAVAVFFAWRVVKVSRRAGRTVTAAVSTRELIQQETLRERRAKADQAEARARDLEAIAAGERRRADRAAGITRSEIAELQMFRDAS